MADHDSLDDLLTAEQIAALRALLNRLIPADDWAGAWDAGVGVYLARQWRGDLRDSLESYRNGLDGLNREAASVGAASFDRMVESVQDALLSRLFRGDVTAKWPTDPVSFIELAAWHATEGYYADPGNGGNRDCVAWSMVGFDPKWTISSASAGSPSR